MDNKSQIAPAKRAQPELTPANAAMIGGDTSSETTQGHATLWLGSIVTMSNRMLSSPTLLN
jgi:hypothetical protein